MTSAPQPSGEDRDLYRGPVLDAHHHFWDLRLNRHKWITQSGAGLGTIGDTAYLQRNYGPDEYQADVAGQGIVGTVHVEAHWDRGDDPVAETRWLATLRRPAWLAARQVAYAALGSPGLERRLRLHAESAGPGRVVGVRESIRAYPDRSVSYHGSVDSRDGAWREGVALLARSGLSLELLIFGHQADEVVELAALHPGLQIVVGHVGSPLEPGPRSYREWIDGLGRMAACPNVSIKLSNFVRYAASQSLDDLARIALPCIEAFGPDRSMFGSDYPVSACYQSFAGICTAMRRIVARWPAGAQRAIFHDTAHRIYRFGADIQPVEGT